MIHTVKDYEKLSEQYNKMLEERNSLIDDLSWYRAKVSRLEQENERLKERNYQLAKTNDGLYLDNYKLEQENEKQLELLQYKEERDTLIDDIAVLKAKVSKLKLENGELQEVIEGKNSDLLFTEDEIIQLEKDFENKHNLLYEISQHIGNKPSSSTYKYFREKLDGVGIKVGE